MIDRIDQNWNGSSWVNKRKFTYSYDGNNIIEVLSQEWVASNWVNDWKETYSYDENNNQTEWLYRYWDNSNWVNQWKNTYTYDANNNLIDEIDQHWLGSNWINRWRSSSTYDMNSNLIERLYQDWDGLNWETSFKMIFNYMFVEIENEVDYKLYQNYPNPFNPTTSIRYELPLDGVATLKIFDILGQEIETIVNEFKNAGGYEIDFNATGLPSGIYFYQLQAGSFVETKKMVLLR